MCRCLSFIIRFFFSSLFWISALIGFISLCRTWPALREIVHVIIGLLDIAWRTFLVAVRNGDQVDFPAWFQRFREAAHNTTA